MSTSPSWFDQDKFSRLVKKVGPKTVAAQPVASQPVPAKAPAQPLLKEASLPPEEKTSLLAPKAPPTESTRLSQRLPKIELKPLASEPDIVPAPIRAEAGSLPTEIEEEAPALPGAVNRPPISVQRMMTSQPLSLGKKSSHPSLPPGALRTVPIRAPESFTSPSTAKTPSLPDGSPSTSGALRRTASLPALKSLFQYEIPGGQGVIPGPGKGPAEPPPPKFTFPRPGAKSPIEVPPPAQDEEEDVPSFSGLSDAGHLAETAESELSAENLAADWGKTDKLNEELARVTKERDAALAEGDSLLQQLRDAQEKASSQGAVDPAELAQITKERDEMRSQYITLRGDFETLKQEKLKPKGEPNEGNAELKKEIETLRGQLAEKDREISKVKISTTGMEDIVATLKEELNGLRDEVKKAKDDAAAAQRGLVLSQKALQDTRDALKK